MLGVGRGDTVRTMDEATALKRLYMLLSEPGALQIINHFHACTPHLMTDERMAALNEDDPIRQQCKAYAEKNGHVAGMSGGYQSVGHYRLHPVTRIEETAKPGVYVAYADDDLGTQCGGRASALLARLTEHEKS